MLFRQGQDKVDVDAVLAAVQAIQCFIDFSGGTGYAGAVSGFRTVGG